VLGYLVAGWSLVRCVRLCRTRGGRCDALRRVWRGDDALLGGLELQPALLWRLRPDSGTRGLQVAVTTLVVISFILGLSWQMALAVDGPLVFNGDRAQTLNEGANQNRRRTVVFLSAAVSGHCSRC